MAIDKAGSSPSPSPKRSDDAPKADNAQKPSNTVTPVEDKKPAEAPKQYATGFDRAAKAPVSLNPSSGTPAPSTSQPMRLSELLAQSARSGAGAPVKESTLSAKAVSADAADGSSGAGATTAVGQKTAADAASDAAEINALTTSDPKAGAKLLQQRVTEEKDPGYRAALLDASKPAITSMSQQALEAEPPRPAQNEPLNTLFSVAHEVGAEGAKTIAVAYQAGNPRGAGVQEDIYSAIKGGNGSQLGIALAGAYQAAGNTETAHWAMTATTDGVYAAQSAFKDASSKVKELDGRLAQELAAASPGLSQDELNKAISKFHELHADEYRAFEDASKSYAAALPDYVKTIQKDPAFTGSYELQGRATAFAQDLPDLANSTAGQTLIADELAKQGRSEPSLLDGLATGKDVKNDFADKLSAAFAKSVGARAISQGLEGSGDALRGLEKNAALFGLSQDSMHELTSVYAEFKPGMTQAEVEGLSQRMNAVLGEANSGLVGADPVSSRGGQALRGLSLIFAGAALTKNFQDFGTADLKSQIKTIGDTISAGTDAGLLALDVIGKNVGRELLEKGNGVGAAIGAFCDGISTIQDVAQGKYAQAFSDGSQAVGGALIAAGALAEGFPVAGTIAGTALVAIGIATKFFLAWKDGEDMKSERKTLLQAAGVQGNALDALSNADPKRMIELQKELGYSPAQVRSLANNSPVLITDNENSGVSLEKFKQLAATCHLTPDQSFALLNHVGAGTSDPNGAAFIFLANVQRDFNGLSTPQQWVDALKARADDSSAAGDDYHTAFQNAYEYLNIFVNPSNDT